MSQLGKAYIEVTADLKKMPAELRAKLKAAMKEALAGVEFTELDDKAEKAGASAAEHVSRGFKRDAKRKLASAGEEGGRSLLGGLKRLFTRNSSEGGGFFSTIGSFFKDAFSQAGQAASSIGGIGSQIGGAFSKIGDIGGEVGSVLKIAAFAVLIPVVLQLAGAVVQLGAAIFALPAAIGVAAAAIVPLIIAFQGFGEAVSAGLSGDVDKFNEALKKLSPSAAAVAKEVVKLGPVFSRLKKTVQEAFFDPLVGVVGPALTIFLNSVTPGLAKVSHALGELGATLLSYLSDEQVLGDLNDLFATTARIVAGLEGPLGRLFGAFFGVLQTGLPFVERFFAAVGSGIDKFVGWLAKIQGDGTLARWLNRASHLLGTIVGLAKDLGVYLITLFGGEIGDNGTEFLDTFREKLQDLLTYIQSPDGKESIHNLGVLLKWVGNIFLFLISTEPAMLRGLNAFFNAVRALARGLETLGGWVVVAAKAVAWFFVQVWGLITSTGGAIGRFFTDTIPQWWDSVIGFFEGLPGAIEGALRAFQERGRALIIETLRSWYEQVFQWIGNIIGIIWSLPQLIPAAFEVLKTNIYNEITAIWQGAVDLFWWGVNSTLAVVEAIPGILGDALSAVGAFFSDTWHGIINDIQVTVETGFHRVMDFFQSLPGRIAALGPALYVAAVQLGHKIGDGLANIGTFASDVGRKIVNTIKSGINWVIGSINSGIAEIDDKLPGTLPRIPMLARGDVVDSPTLALVGEAGPEVVIPLSDRKRAQELAEQSGLLSMLRNTGGAKGGPTVVVYLDPSGVLIPITKTVVRDTLDEEGDQLAYARAA
jgi:hypothetical protein